MEKETMVMIAALVVLVVFLFYLWPAMNKPKATSNEVPIAIIAPANAPATPAEFMTAKQAMNGWKKSLLKK
jgi:hypothetical protein